MKFTSESLQSTSDFRASETLYFPRRLPMTGLGRLPTEASRPTAARNRPACASATWVPDLYREQALRLAVPYVYVPFAHFGVTPWHGKYFNNDEHTAGVWRRTLDAEGGQCSQQPKTSVWVFGGSTVYGTGVPDWATLPSYLSSSLKSVASACVAVTNFGSESYVSTQEVLLLSEQLKRGGKPDIVIFYDGFNDAHGGMAASDPWVAHYEYATIKARTEGSVRGRFDFVHRLYTVRIIDAARQLFQRRGESLNAVVRLGCELFDFGRDWGCRQ